MKGQPYSANRISFLLTGVIQNDISTTYNNVSPFKFLQRATNEFDWPNPSQPGNCPCHRQYKRRSSNDNKTAAAKESRYPILRQVSILSFFRSYALPEPGVTAAIELTPARQTSQLEVCHT
jgi:hypothetical protein